MKNKTRRTLREYCISFGLGRKSRPQHKGQAVNVFKRGLRAIKKLYNATPRNKRCEIVAKLKGMIKK